MPKADAASRNAVFFPVVVEHAVSLADAPHQGGLTGRADCDHRWRSAWRLETWVESPVGDDWIVAYRLLPQNGTAVIAELRVFPAKPAQRRPGQNVYGCEPGKLLMADG